MPYKDPAKQRAYKRRYNAAYYAGNRELWSGYKARFKAAHPGKLAEYDRKGREEHRDEYNERSREAMRKQRRPYRENVRFLRALGIIGA